MNVRVATEDDLEGIVETLSLAFESDPLWSWAFPDRAAQASWWRLLTASALRYPWTWVAGDFAAVSVWIPPGGVELTAAEESRVGPLIADLAGDRAPEVLELLESFDTSHPAEPPHFYLSLLATNPRHRGEGLGMALLAENLKAIDLESAPAFLESSNATNDFRYEERGFRRIGGFDRPDGRTTAATMWREPSVAPERAGRVSAAGR